MNSDDVLFDNLKNVIGTGIEKYCYQTLYNGPKKKNGGTPVVKLSEHNKQSSFSN